MSCPNCKAPFWVKTLWKGKKGVTMLIKQTCKCDIDISVLTDEHLNLRVFA